MNKVEALKVLGLQSGATEDEIKKKFRKLAYDKHPDRNKEPSAEDEYKKISEAFEYLKNPKPEMGGFSGGPGFSGINISDFMSGMGGMWGQSQTIYRPPPINISISLSFIDSVLGCKKKLKFDRVGPCSKCKGLGYDSCTNCNGTGYTETFSQQGNIQYCNRQGCCKCRGSGHADKICDVCVNKKTKKEHIEVDVNIPGGVHDSQIIRLRGAGNVNEQCNAQGDVLLTTRVESDHDMRIVGQDVISIIELPLHEALKGVNKKIRTVKGDMTIAVNSGAKHRDQIKLSGYGVEGRGDHLFLIEIKYPKEIDKLIEFLENNKET
jgi:molecular chaperone DnaJ